MTENFMVMVGLVLKGEAIVMKHLVEAIVTLDREIFFNQRFAFSLVEKDPKMSSF
jgi:hypothetical protein